MPALHDDELDVDSRLVRRLVDRSLPQYVDVAIRPLPSAGSSNALFRLGEDLLVRLPRQPGGTTTIEKEARWLPVIAPGVTTAVPEVVAVGDPGLGYPERWAVTKWLSGHVPSVPWEISRRGSSQRLADDLARLVAELRCVPVPPAADRGSALTSYRGGRLSDADQDFRRSLAECHSIEGLGLDLERARQVWDAVLVAERATASPRTWYHGDLLAENLLLRGGELAAVLDFGGLGVGDPAVDVVAAWEVLDPEGRRTFRRALAVDDADWAKGAGWALLVAMMTFPYYRHTMPARCAARRSMAEAVLAEM